MWKQNIIHRDIKLANILLHFPENREIEHMSSDKKRAFLRNFDFGTGKFTVFISDFGLSTVRMANETGQQSICGNPFRIPPDPELLKKRLYTYKADMWAIGIMCFEMLMGKTPFHATEMRDLI